MKSLSRPTLYQPTQATNPIDSLALDFHFKQQLLLKIMWISAIFAMIFAILSTLGINQLGEPHTTVDYLYTLISITLAIFLRRNPHWYQPIVLLFLLICYLGCSSALLYATVDEFRAIWFYLLVVTSFLLAHPRLAAFITSLSIGTIVFVNQVVTEHYSDIALSSIIIGIIVVAAILATFTQQMRLYLLALAKQSAELSYLANKDPLTEALSSGSYCEQNIQLFHQAITTGQPLAMLYIAVAQYPMLRRKYGRSTTQAVIAHITQLVSDNLSQNALLNQVRQDEFCILLPNYDPLDAKRLAEKFIKVSQLHLYSRDNEQIAVALAIGITCILPGDTDIRSIQIRADKALNKAKSLGGNQIIFEGERD